MLDSVNYLTESEYIQLRDISSKTPATLADCEADQLEAKLTDKGIKLLSGRLKDELVDI